VQVPLPLLFGIWVALAVLGGTVLWLAARRQPELATPLLPLQRERAVPWDGFDILFISVLVFFLIPGTVLAALEESGFYRWYFGVSLLDEKAPFERMSLWARTAAFPLQMMLFFFLLHIRGRLELYQLGLTPVRLLPNITLGFRAWLVLTPIVFAVMIGAEKAYALWSPFETHPLVEAAQKQMPVIEWGWIFFLAVIAAPVTEELMFRGLIQRWAQVRLWGPDAILVAAFVFALYTRSKDLETALSRADSHDRLVALVNGTAPALFILLMIPGYIYSEVFAWRWLPYPNAARSIYATSLLFAAVHSSVWPSPIPLFVMSLGLGFVAYRTQSLIPSITFHALFNLVSCIAMVFLPPKDQAKNGNEATSALRRSPPASTSSVVPGVSLPRRM
jgi:membrane protease YdiL (CAAX protease family)